MSDNEEVVYTIGNCAWCGTHSATLDRRFGKKVFHFCDFTCLQKFEDAKPKPPESKW